jgi:hypothetical protein
MLETNSSLQKTLFFSLQFSPAQVFLSVPNHSHSLKMNTKALALLITLFGLAAAAPVSLNIH